MGIVLFGCSEPVDIEVAGEFEGEEVGGGGLVGEFAAGAVEAGVGAGDVFGVVAGSGSGGGEGAVLFVGEFCHWMVHFVDWFALWFRGRGLRSSFVGNGG